MDGEVLSAFPLSMYWPRPRRRWCLVTRETMVVLYRGWSCVGSGGKGGKEEGGGSGGGIDSTASKVLSLEQYQAGGVLVNDGAISSSCGLRVWRFGGVEIVCRCSCEARGRGSYPRQKGGGGSGKGPFDEVKSSRERHDCDQCCPVNLHDLDLTPVSSGIRRSSHFSRKVGSRCIG